MILALALLAVISFCLGFISCLGWVGWRILKGIRNVD